MNTNEAAARLGTTARILRQFLRSPGSTFVAVGSSSRYDFTDRDMPMLTKRFNEWKTNGKPRSAGKPPSTDTPARKSKLSAKEKQRIADEKVWAEEEPFVLPDISDPKIRARVRRDEAAREERLMMLLMAEGLHLTQRGRDR